MNPKSEFRNRLHGQFNKPPVLMKTWLPQIKTALCLAAASGVTFLFQADAQITNPTPAYVAAWGNDSVGQTDVPVGSSNVVAIAAGGSHSLALKNNGRSSRGDTMVKARLMCRRD
jgi:hypothetical protein